MIAVKAIMPSGRIAIAAAHPKMRHRDAHNWIITHGQELRVRFGIRLFVGTI